MKVNEFLIRVILSFVMGFFMIFSLLFAIGMANSGDIVQSAIIAAMPAAILCGGLLLAFLSMRLMEKVFEGDKIET